MGEEKGIERDLPGVQNKYEKDDANRTRIVALAKRRREKERENLEGRWGGDKTSAREREIISVERRQRDISSKLSRTHTRLNIHIHWAVKLAHYRLPERLPPRTFGKINRIQEKPMVRQASRSPLSSASLVFSFSLFPSLSLSLFPSATLSPITLPAPHATSLSRARARYSCLLTTKRGYKLASIHWRSTEIGDMRARTMAKDGDKDKRGVGGEYRLGSTGVYVREAPSVSDSIRAR